MNQAFVPTNELEHRLLEAQAGRLPPQELLTFLLDAQVFMPVFERQVIRGFGPSQTAQPLLIRDDASGEESLVLFTGPERAKGFLADHPGYGGGLLVQFQWILEKAGVGYGISINPGLAVGLELEAEALRQLGGGPG